MERPQLILTLRIFHLVDLDNDKDFDVIYTGWSGAESQWVKFYLNKFGRLVDGPSVFGKIVDIKKITSSEFLMLINSPGCCADPETRDFKINVTIKPGFTEFKYFETKISNSNTIKPSKYFGQPIHFRVKNDKYYLRYTPVIDSTEIYAPGDQIGNISNVYSIGDIGTAFAESKDNSGRVWWYVEMRPIQNDTTTYTYKETKTIPSYIWMSSKYLEVLKTKGNSR
jgi:hypothetical protein